ncbi:MAG: hypothetical protein ABI454_07705 [Sphingomicrobium sp.]
MKDVGIITLLSVIISAAAPSSPNALETGPAKSFATAKSIDQFASCFTDTQDRGALPWSYVRKEDGGTFSNLGSRTIKSAYFVVVSDRGPSREVRLEGNGASEIAVNQAVDQCV